MVTLILILFIAGYTLIAFENKLHINKSGVAVFTGIILWVIYNAGWDKTLVESGLSHHIEEIAGILFFLMGAMTIVEIIDQHDGFTMITGRVHTKSKIKLLWIIGVITFFMSALLDNLTTAIVMTTIIRKMLPEKKERLFFAGIIIIAANSGGAWSPIGDVTTTMLWIGGKLTELQIIKTLFLPSLISLLIPLLYVTFFQRKMISGDLPSLKKSRLGKENKLIFFCGTGGLILVPVFKMLTGLPPYIGIMLVLGLLWIIADLIHRRKDEEVKSAYSTANAIRRIDMPSILFFLGILMAVAVLQETGILKVFTIWLDRTIGNQDLIVILIGILSAVVDNVPLVAASMGMYDFPVDHKVWEFIAYCAGTGGSILIIGSAAGVAAMGIEKIDFIWYLRKISFIAFIGYLAGALVYLAEFALLNP